MKVQTGAESCLGMVACSSRRGKQNSGREFFVP